MLSGLVYAAVGQVSNRFQLCASVALATRKLHVPSTPVGTTIGRVLNTLASGKYETGSKVQFESAAIKEAAKQRTAIQDEMLALQPWGMHLHQDMSGDELHRVLAGMR